MTVQEMLLEFHRAFDCSVDDRSSRVVEIRETLIKEEYLEVENELDDVWLAINDPDRDLNGAVTRLAKELADLVYVTYGTAVALGIDLDKAVELVHTSNMSKVGDDGKPTYRADGKVLKGPNYKAPDLTDTVKEL
jgi:NTP pyrophosphatase (non-canonical NTP hydrolase)